MTNLDPKQSHAKQTQTPQATADCIDANAMTTSIDLDQSSNETSSVVANADQIPQKIGRYTVIGLLGKGGQSVIYRAVHPSLPIELAIKVSKRPIDPAGRSTILQEAAILCDLDHDNIAKIRDLDFHEGCPYLALDLIRGRSLAELLADHSVSTKQAIVYLQTVAQAIDYAHGRGVLHLDLKPENLVIDEKHSPRVIDFGLSKIRGIWQDRSQEIDSITGTFGYMAPEQAIGKSDQITHASDVFALGAILYRILVGNAPFTGRTESEVLRAVRACQFDREALTKLDVPKRFVSTCLKAMSASPHDRFHSAGEFAGSLGNNRKLQASLSTQFMGCGVSLAVTLTLLLLVYVYGFDQPGGTSVAVSSYHDPIVASQPTMIVPTAESPIAPDSPAPAQPMKVPSDRATWGWGDQSSTPDDVSPAEYLTSLSRGAKACFSNLPANNRELKQRLTEFEQGCERLLSLNHDVLSEDDRAWLIFKCKGWKKEIRQPIDRVDSVAFDSAHQTANDLATEISQTLQQRSKGA